ncbi:MAG: SPOR domain-containing protein [Flavobacteriales bacterium]
MGECFIEASAIFAFMQTFRKSFLLLSVFFLVLSGKAQVDSSDDWNRYDTYKERRNKEMSKGEKDSGTVKVHQPELLDSLIVRYRRVNKEFPKIQGYRVQLFFGKRKKAEKIKADFKEKYKEVPAHIGWLKPNFRLRVGDFRERIEAYRFLQKIGDQFGRAYIVRCKIELPELSIVEEKEKAEGGSKESP